MQDQNKVIHDINSSISAISQSLSLINDNWKNNPEIVEKILPLVLEKAVSLEEQWNQAKNIIKNKG
ncbi:hypothetical protein [Halobacteriovorax sp.]|uniref:hypothetical protein n=1 Tax=Halobacteriovorax sp. TaxID=2020862 RepID=UPI00356823C4